MSNIQQEKSEIKKEKPLITHEAVRPNVEEPLGSELKEGVDKGEDSSPLKWSQEMVEKYKDEIGDGVRTVEKEEAIIFFREAFIFWQRELEKINSSINLEDMSPLDQFKIRFVNFQINELHRKLKSTDIDLSELDIINHLSPSF